MEQQAEEENNVHAYHKDRYNYQFPKTVHVGD